MTETEAYIVSCAISGDTIIKNHRNLKALKNICGQVSEIKVKPHTMTDDILVIYTDCASRSPKDGRLTPRQIQAL